MNTPCNPERTMTSHDWANLHAACYRVIDAADNRDSVEAKLYQALAEKCFVRMMAAREGRVMP